MQDRGCVCRTEGGCAGQRGRVQDRGGVCRTEGVCAGQRGRVQDRGGVCRTEGACAGQRVCVQDRGCVCRTEGACADTGCVCRTEGVCAGQRVCVQDRGCVCRTEGACAGQRGRVREGGASLFPQCSSAYLQTTQGAVGPAFSLPPVHHRSVPQCCGRWKEWPCCLLLSCRCCLHFVHFQLCGRGLCPLPPLPVLQLVLPHPPLPYLVNRHPHPPQVSQQ